MIEARRTCAAPEETRERILAAAREVIARKGKRGATTREIADVAGVNEATLFRHFGTKEALMVSVAEHFCPYGALREVSAHLRGLIADDLLALGSVLYEHFVKQMDMIRWSLVENDYEGDIFATTAWRPQLAVHAVIAEFMERRIRSGELHGDPEKLAMTFLGLVFMHVLAADRFPDSDLHTSSPQKALLFYIDVFLNGVRSRDGHA